MDHHIQQLQEEKEQYRRNFEAIKSQFINLNHLYQDQGQKWSAQIEEKNRVIDILRQQSEQCKGELESMKVRLHEEMELRSRLEREAHENELYHSRYMKLKRECELNKRAMEEEKRLLEKELREIKYDCELKVQELAHEKNIQSQMVPQESIPFKIEKQLALQRKKDELEDKVEKLLEELNDVRSENAKLSASKEEMNLNLSKQYNNILAKCKSQDMDIENYKKKIERLRNEVETVTLENDKKHEKILRLEREFSYKQTQLEERIQKTISERELVKSQYEQKVLEVKREHQQLANQLNEYKKRCEELQFSKETIEKKFSDSKTEWNNKINTIICDEERKFASLEHERDILRSKVRDFESIVKSLTFANEELKRNELSQGKENHMIELNSAKQRLEFNVNYLQRQLKETSFELDTTRKERDESVRKLQELSSKSSKDTNEKMEVLKEKTQKSVMEKKKLEKMIEKYREKAKQRINDLENKVQELQTRLLDVEREYEDLKNLQFVEQQRSQKQVKNAEHERDQYRMMYEQMQQQQMHQLLNPLGSSTKIIQEFPTTS